MTVNPCMVGLNCPFEHLDEDGMAYCTYPDIEPRRRKEYYCITDQDDECDLYPAPDSPLEQLIEGFDRLELKHKSRSNRTYRAVKVTVEIRGDSE